MASSKVTLAQSGLQFHKQCIYQTIKAFTVVEAQYLIFSNDNVVRWHTNISVKVKFPHKDTFMNNNAGPCIRIFDSSVIHYQNMYYVIKHILHVVIYYCECRCVSEHSWKWLRYHNYRTCAQPTCGANCPSATPAATLLPTCLFIQL